MGILLIIMVSGTPHLRLRHHIWHMDTVRFRMDITTTCHLRHRLALLRQDHKHIMACSRLRRLLVWLVRLMDILMHMHMDNSRQMQK